MGFRVHVVGTTGILAFDPPPCRPEKYVFTNGEVCIVAESAELAERHWVATMDRRYRGPAWVVAVTRSWSRCPPGSAWVPRARPL